MATTQRRTIFVDFFDFFGQPLPLEEKNMVHHINFATQKWVSQYGSQKKKSSAAALKKIYFMHIPFLNL